MHLVGLVKPLFSQLDLNSIVVVILSASFFQAAKMLSCLEMSCKKNSSICELNDQSVHPLACEVGHISRLTLLLQNFIPWQDGEPLKLGRLTCSLRKQEKKRSFETDVLVVV